GKRRVSAALQSPASLKRIEHIVVIYLENRSFDHLYGTFPGADGLNNAKSAARQVDASGKPYERLPAFSGHGLDASVPALELPALPNEPFDLARYMTMDKPLNAGFEQANSYYLGRRAVNGGKMDGYVAISGSAVMGYYDGRGLPMWR